MTNFIRAGSGRDFEHAPPIIDFGLLRCLLILPLTLSLSLAVLLASPPPFFSLSFLFDLSLGLVLPRFIPSPLGFLLLLFSLAPNSGVVSSPAADVSMHPPNRHQPNKDDHSWEAVKAVIAHGEQHDARPDAQCARFHAHPGFTPAPTRAENQPSSRSHSITRLRRHLNNRSAPLIGLIAIEAKDKQANS